MIWPTLQSPIPFRAKKNCGAHKPRPRSFPRPGPLAHKPAVCGRDFPIACLRTASRASTASNRGGNVFFRFAPPCASLARCSVPAHFVCSALQPFGPSPFCKHLHPQFAIVDLHRSQARLQLSLLTGLTSACFVPQFAIVALLRCRLQVSFAHWTSASPVSRTARGEAPSHRRRPPCAPQKIPEMTYTPSFLI